MDSDSDSDDIPLAHLKKRSDMNDIHIEIDNDSSDSENSDIVSTGSEFTPQICDVKGCKKEACAECDECSMSLCIIHEIPKTKCKEKHRIVIKPR